MKNLHCLDASDIAWLAKRLGFADELEARLDARQAADDAELASLLEHAESVERLPPSEPAEPDDADEGDLLPCGDEGDNTPRSSGELEAVQPSSGELDAGASRSVHDTELA